MQTGTLIHTARFYNEISINGFAGATEKSLALVKTVKCSVEDNTYKNKISNNKNSFDTTLKITTWFFKSNINMIVKINNDECLYKIDYIENVEFRNTKLIFTLSKYKLSLTV